MSDPSKPRCGNIDACLQIIGDKWSGLIIRELTGGAKRFTELEQTLGIGPRTLSQRLDNLEAAYILSKHQFAEVPPRVEYALTPKGEALLPILRSMASWASTYGSH
ncbi:MAG TPA: helix-turn-helix domain-containing protein [Candidatus Saccharimonadales bacterium]|nr:helix-turn-helix domain-containing protein [Candidatus Saccharimonadales bacterium]